MKKLVLTVWVAFAGLFLAGGLLAQSFSYSSEFILPEEFPLHHVYVGIQGPGGLDGSMLPRELNPTLEEGLVRPPGFEVPVGSSSFDLVPVNPLGIPHLSQWAVMGLYTDEYGKNHIVLGTNADLTGVQLCSQELLGGIWCSENGIIEALESGSLLGEGGSSIAGAILYPMRVNDLMLDWGERSQLFFFSEGQAIPGGSVEAVEMALVPQPPTELGASQAWLSRAIDITWQDNSDNETGFQLQYRAVPWPPFGWRTLAELDTDVTSYRLFGRFNIRYHFRVAAFNAAGVSPWSNEESVTVLYWVTPVVIVGLALVVMWRWRAARRA